MKKILQLVSYNNFEKAYRYLTKYGLKALLWKCKIHFMGAIAHSDSQLDDEQCKRISQYQSQIIEDVYASIDIVIPIYNAADDLADCYASVLKYTNLKKHRLILINDHSCNYKISILLDKIQRDAEIGALNIVILHNSSNMGFVKTVNVGMRFSESDVILLNSDTVVTQSWVEKLQLASCSYSNVATVTPFSNNATICSLPKFLEDNPIPCGYSIDAFAQLVERISMLRYPEIPTGIGFCMYITRRAIKEIGIFDEAEFGKGYCEENDFCMRASNAGYRNLLCDNLFIYHKGGQSFTDSVKTKRQEENLEKLVRRYPDYLTLINEYVYHNPIRYYHDIIPQILAEELKFRERESKYAGL